MTAANAVRRLGNESPIFRRDLIPNNQTPSAPATGTAEGTMARSTIARLMTTLHSASVPKFGSEKTSMSLKFVGGWDAAWVTPRASTGYLMTQTMASMMTKSEPMWGGGEMGERIPPMPVVHNRKCDRDARRIL